jgi:neutral ceramidase
MIARHSRRDWLRRAALASGGLALPALRARAEDKTFRAGAFAIDVTPERFPISMNGQMHDQVARSAFDRLHARSLVLDDGATRLAIVVVDSCMVPQRLFDEAKRRAGVATGIPAGHMLMSATHTHTAPAVAGVFQTEPDAGYAEFLTGRIAAGVERAFKNLAPARVGWGVGQDPSQVFCRRWLMKPGTAQTNPFGGTRDDRAQMHPGYQNPNALRPTGPVDPDISLLSVQSPDGRPIALLANYGMHYAGYGIPPGTASADYFGRFAERIKGLIGAGDADPPFVGIMSNGPCAETHCYDYSKPRQPVDIHSVADSVAHAALAAYKKIEYRDHARLVVRERRLRLGLRLPPEDEVARAREVLEKAKGRPLQGLAEVYARETVLLSEGPKDAEVPLQAMRVGDLGLAAIPCEVYAETGLEIKRRSPLKPTFVVELANGYNGYLPPPEQHALGGYTTWRARSSCLEVGAEPKVRDAVLGLLEDVARA